MAMERDFDPMSVEKDNRPAVSIALDELRATVDDLSKDVGKLLDRVAPVTAPDSEAYAPNESGKLVDAKVSSPLTCEINSIGRQLADLSRSVSYVSRRIEL